MTLFRTTMYFNHITIVMQKQCMAKVALQLVPILICKWVILSRNPSKKQNKLRCFLLTDFTWIAIDVHLRWAGHRPGKDTLIQSFGGCGMLGLFNAGALGLPDLLPKSQLHCEDLQQRHPEAMTCHDRSCINKSDGRQPFNWHGWWNLRHNYECY